MCATTRCMQLPCRADKQRNHPTSVLLVLSRTQVHAFGGFNVLELPLALIGRLGLSLARDVRVFPRNIGTDISLSLQVFIHNANVATC